MSNIHITHTVLHVQLIDKSTYIMGAVHYILLASHRTQWASIKNGGNVEKKMVGSDDK